MNDADARFCSECGGPIDAALLRQSGKGRKVYLYALLFLPVLALAAGIGYYKYVLPGGAAAIVNGEQIMLSEIDTAVSELTGESGAADPKLRYQILNGLITERMVLQQARKTGLSISREQVNAAVDEARRASGISGAAFDRDAETRYGSMRNFEAVLARRLLVNKFLAEKVIPRDVDARTAGLVMNRWLQDLSGKADVRITLAEQLSGAGGCGCCNKRPEASGSASGSGSASLVTKAEASSSAPATGSSEEDRASAAALKYWQEKHGDEKVTTRVKNFGCHVEVDIVKDDKTVGSLRYQRGRISER
jgi:hypothetical protein